MVFHQDGLIKVVSHTLIKVGLSSRLYLVKVVCHQDVLSSGWSVIRVVSHRGGFSSGWFFIGWFLISGSTVFFPTPVAEEEEEDAAARGAAAEDDRGMGKNFKYGLLHNFARLDLSA